jgi:2'-5' RNA ligase
MRVYDHIWADAMARFVRGTVETDPYLLDKQSDRRLGITLRIHIETPAVAAGFSEIIEQLREQEPDQYYYYPDEYHVTLLALVSAAMGFDLADVPTAVYDRVFAGIFGHVRTFGIRFHGITASPSSVMVQGFSENGYLNEVREIIRCRLDQAGLGDTLDQRYRITTAHSTIMRFRSQPRCLPALISQLTALRERQIGTARVEGVDFVFNDWYMSRGRVRVLSKYGLCP